MLIRILPVQVQARCYTSVCQISFDLPSAGMPKFHFCFVAYVKSVSHHIVFFLGTCTNKTKESHVFECSPDIGEKIPTLSNSVMVFRFRLGFCIKDEWSLSFFLTCLFNASFYSDAPSFCIASQTRLLIYFVGIYFVTSSLLRETLEKAIFIWLLAFLIHRRASRKLNSTSYTLAL